jgi:hypothetical protein
MQALHQCEHDGFHLSFEGGYFVCMQGIPSLQHPHNC